MGESDREGEGGGWGGGGLCLTTLIILSHS